MVFIEYLSAKYQKINLVLVTIMKLKLVNDKKCTVPLHQFHL